MAIVLRMVLAAAWQQYETVSSCGRVNGPHIITWTSRINIDPYPASGLVGYDSVNYFCLHDTDLFAA